MAFQVKTDFCGLVAATTPSGTGSTPCLVIRDDNENLSTEKYQPQGQDGSFVATEVYGADSAPANSYGLKAKITATAGMIKLGKIVTITDGDTTKKYALEKVSISTGAAQVVTLSATCQEVESSADDSTMSYYSVPAFVLDKAQVAQDIFTAISLTGTGCQITKIDYDISCTVNKDKVAGTKIASDVNSGVITTTGTILQTGSTKPTLAVNSENDSGWVITQAPNCSNPETAYKEYSFEMQLALAKTTPSAS